MSQWAWEEGSGWTHTPPTALGWHTSRLQPVGRLHPGRPTWEGKQVAQPSKAPGDWPEALLPGLPDQDAVTTGSQLLIQGLEQQTRTTIWSHHTAPAGPRHSRGKPGPLLTSTAGPQFMGQGSGQPHVPEG